MGVGVRHGVALRALLQVVVADSVGGVEGFFDVAAFKQAVFLGIVRPHAGIAVGLQFEPHGKLVGLLLIHVLLGVVNLLDGAEQGLHVVADFMRQHIGKSRIAAGAQLVGHGVVEGKVDIEFLVARTVKRAGAGLAGATGGGDAVAVEREFGRLVLAADFAEIGFPHFFGVAQHHRAELHQLFFLGAFLQRRGLLLLRAERKAAVVGDQPA